MPAKVIPIQRVERKDMFEAFDKDSRDVIREARKDEMHLTDYLNKMVIPNKDDELSPVDYMLWQYGFECFDAGYTPSSPLKRPWRLVQRRGF